MPDSDCNNSTVGAVDYISDNFQPDDRVAVVIKNQHKNQLIQRIVTVQDLAANKFQAWLRFEDRLGSDIYVSMNPLKQDSWHRTKNDIAAVRHLYLDLDRYAVQSLFSICRDPRLPVPSYILNTSDGKYQIVWKVVDCDPDRAEQLQRSMAFEYGADRAATDVTRVLRIPGFYNHKYDPPYQVTAEHISSAQCMIRDFNIPPPAEIHTLAQTVERRLKAHPGCGQASQSERDWAETLRRLERGEHPTLVKAWLESSRPDKYRPAFYAALTVKKALAVIERRREGTSLEFE
ncbi:MAG: hypothetical protein JXA73_03090 [Acidobacteria bacterium]|nr:hypothetical protein [Acidobacteriota bacterium]